MSAADAERVLVVPRDVVPDRAGWHGLRVDGVHALLDAVRAHGAFLPRDAMERDPLHKQIISDDLRKLLV